MRAGRPARWGVREARLQLQNRSCLEGVCRGCWEGTWAFEEAGGLGSRRHEGGAAAGRFATIHVKPWQCWGVGRNGRTRREITQVKSRRGLCVHHTMAVSWPTTRGSGVRSMRRWVCKSSPSLSALLLDLFSTRVAILSVSLNMSPCSWIRRQRNWHSWKYWIEWQRTAS